MADAGTIGTFKWPHQVQALDAWGNSSIQTYPVMALKAPQHSVRKLPTWDLRGGDSNLLTLRVDGKIEGYVYSSVGTPLAYQWVRLYLPETGALIAQVRTNADGYYLFLDLNPDHYYIVTPVFSTQEADSKSMSFGPFKAVLA